MIIVAGGDSFVAGSELEHSDNNFTKLVSQQYTNYINVATPGNSNEAIARQTINALESLTKDKFAIVSWTFPGRYEFRFNYDTKQRTGHWYSINSWTIESDLSSIEKEFHTQDDGILTAQQDTIKRANETGVAGFAQTFYKHVGSSEYWEIYSTLKEIVYLQNYLKSNSIPYMFTCADNCILYNYTIENADVSIKTLYNLIDMNKWFFKLLDIDTEIIYSSELCNDDLRGLDKIIYILKKINTKRYITSNGPGASRYIDESVFKNNNIELIWNEYTHPIYNQQFGEFIPYMSILDLLFNEGPNSKNII